MQILPSAAFKVSEHDTIGVSIALAAQVFRAYGLESFNNLGFSISTEALTNRGPDWSYGLGWRSYTYAGQQLLTHSGDDVYTTSSLNVFKSTRISERPPRTRYSRLSSGLRKPPNAFSPSPCVN